MVVSDNDFGRLYGRCETIFARMAAELELFLAAITIYPPTPEAPLDCDAVKAELLNLERQLKLLTAQRAAPLSEFLQQQGIAPNDQRFVVGFYFYQKQCGERHFLRTKALQWWYRWRTPCDVVGKAPLVASYYERRRALGNKKQAVRERCGQLRKQLSAEHARHHSLSSDVAEAKSPYTWIFQPIIGNIAQMLDDVRQAQRELRVYKHCPRKGANKMWRWVCYQSEYALLRQQMELIDKELGHGWSKQCGECIGANASADRAAPVW